MSKNTGQYGFKTEKKIKEHLNECEDKIKLKYLSPLFDTVPKLLSLLQFFVTLVIVCYTLNNFYNNIWNEGQSNPFTISGLNDFLGKIDIISKNIVFRFILFILLIFTYGVGLINISYDLLNKSQDIINYIILFVMFLSGTFFNLDKGLSDIGTVFINIGSFIYVITFISRMVTFLIKKNNSNKNLVKTMNIINLVCLFISLVCFIFYFIYKDR